MWSQFILQNAHFALNLFAALVLFAVFWLYFDAWKEHKKTRDTPRLIGYLLLSASFVIHASFVESSVLAASFIPAPVHEILLAAVRILGYALLLTNLISDPVEPVPGAERSRPGTLALMPVAAISATLLPQVLFPVFAAGIALMYLRRATVGLETHLKPVSLSFFFLAGSELVSIASWYRGSDSVAVYQLSAPFGPLWILEHALLACAIIIIGKWVFGYLLKQFETQLFIILTTLTLLIFLVTTVSFTGLLVNNIRDETLDALTTNVKVLRYAIDSKRAEVVADAGVLARDPRMTEALFAGDRNTLSAVAQSFLLAKKESTLVIANESGQVLVRAEDRDRTGDSLSGDTLFKRAVLGGQVSSVVTREGVLAPEVSVRGAVGVIRDGAVIGVVYAGTLIDTAFVDGLKKATGLDCAVFGENKISASTLVTPDGKSRWIGILEGNPAIVKQVLAGGQSYVGSSDLFQVPYYGAYLPLLDADNNPVGMLFVGKPQYSVLQTAGRSIQLTFMVTVALLLLSVIPSYLVAKYIAYQI